MPEFKQLLYNPETITDWNKFQEVPKIQTEIIKVSGDIKDYLEDKLPGKCKEENCMN
jgi:hypothetical protein